MAETAGLGDEVKDSLCGFKGIVTGISFFIHGCVRCEVSGKTSGGEPVCYAFDQPQLKVTKKGKIPLTPKAKKEDTHGPRRSIPRRGLL